VTTELNLIKQLGIKMNNSCSLLFALLIVINL
jgi:hypothetical protein